MKHFILFHFLLFAMLFVFPQQGFTTPILNAKEIPIMRIESDQLTPLEKGLEVGRQSKKLFPDIEKRYDTHLATLLTPSLSRKLQQEILPQLLKQLPPEYQEELNGVAQAWSLTRTNQLGDGELSLKEYQLLNLLPDLGVFPDGTGFGVFGEVAKDNSPIIGRNLDWTSTPELRSLQAITVYQSSDKAFVNIGFAGIISVLTGFNHRGLFLAYNKAEPYLLYQQTPHSLENIHSSVFDLRQVLESRWSNQQATLYLSKQSYRYSHSILISDKNNIQILEYPRGGVAKIRRWNSPTRIDKPWDKKLQQIALIGCHVLASLPNNCRSIKESYHWTRLSQLAIFTPSTPADAYDIRDILADRKNHLFEIFNAKTLQSIIYQPKNNYLSLYTATIKKTSVLSPIYHTYPDIIPEGLEHRVNNNKRLILWGITAFLFFLMAWLVWQDRNSH